MISRRAAGTDQFETVQHQSRMSAFISSTPFPCLRKPSYQVTTCTAARPPNDPSELRTESQRRRNSPPKPMKRRRRRQEETKLDWDAMPSVPLVRRDASPESGEDYWMEIDQAVRLSDPDMGEMGKRKRRGKQIDDNLKNKLKREVVSPWKDNWILTFGVVVLLLVLLVSVFGGLDTIPIISVPDL